MKYRIHPQRTTQTGFTLIELLVSVALFVVVMVVSVGTLLSLVDANQKAQSIKSVMNNLNFSLDSMTRTIRTGREFFCVTGAQSLSTLPRGVEDCPNGGEAVVVTDDRGERVGYRFNRAANQGRGALERKVNTGSWVPLTAPDVEIENLRFYVTGPGSQAYGNPDTVQPTVTISIRGRAGSQVNTATDFNVQTTVTQWLLDQ